MDVDETMMNDDEINDRGVRKTHSPTAEVIASLLINDTINGDNSMNTCTVSSKIKEALSLMGSLMQIQGRTNYTKENAKQKWVKVVQLLYEAKTGWEYESPDGKGDDDGDAEPIIQVPKTPLYPDLTGYDLHLSSFLERAICHAAIQSVDHYESLCIARSICSESVVLRSNSPECWHRYGKILELLGDEENAADAFHASISLGAGEGGQLGSHR